MKVTYNVDEDIKILKKRLEHYYGVDLNGNTQDLNDGYYIRKLKSHQKELETITNHKENYQVQYLKMLQELEKHYLWHFSINCII